MIQNTIKYGQYYTCVTKQLKSGNMHNIWYYTQFWTFIGNICVCIYIYIYTLKKLFIEFTKKKIKVSGCNQFILATFK